MPWIPEAYPPGANVDRVMADVAFDKHIELLEQYRHNGKVMEKNNRLRLPQSTPSRHSKGWKSGNCRIGKHSACYALDCHCDCVGHPSRG